MVWTPWSAFSSQSPSSAPSIVTSPPPYAAATARSMPRPAASPAAPKKTGKDYTLPPSFIPLLSRPLADVLAERLPIRITSNPPSSVATSTPTHPFMDALKNTPDTKTWNGADAFSSTGAPLVDFFFDYAPHVEAAHLRGLLEKAWRVDPVATMQIIFHGRSIHEGKGMRNEFYLAMGWLMDKHPRTLIDNLHLVVDPTCARHRNKERDAAKARKDVTKGLGVLALDDDGEVEGSLGELPEYPARPHGYYKDLTELLSLYINGELNSTHDGKLTSIDEQYHEARFGKALRQHRINRAAGLKGGRHPLSKSKKTASKPAVGLSFRESLRAAEKTARFGLLRGRLETTLQSDKKFQALYVAVVDLFVKALRHDLTLLAKHRDFLRLPRAQRAPFGEGSSPHLFGMSFAAKWVPSPDKSDDKQLHFATALATILCPGLEVGLARQKLQKTVLTPLRAVLKVPETMMKQGKWTIDYTKVPAKCMSRNANNFISHDPNGFKAYLTKVAEGRYAIAGASLLPHELLMDAVGSNPIVTELANLQWKSLVSSIASSSNSKLDNCLAIADVSGSMGRYLDGSKQKPCPVTVCIALTLLLGELAAPPWNGSFFTFSTNPKVQHIDPSAPLSERASTLSRAEWEFSTAYYKVFDLILTTAKANNLKPDQMVKRLFVFSDMQFDQGTDRSNAWSEHRLIKRKFDQAGYELPELIYWNLAAASTGISKPVRETEENVSLVSGYSGALMKHFLRQEDAANAADEEELVNGMNKDLLGGGVGRGASTATSVSSATGEKPKADPMKTLRAIIANEAFKGVVIRD